ncbi:MAG: ribonuclease HII [Candidatus Poribacteria bacterium]|nr:ribonuclease HII [Candidatus Poribacteria bacterium]
MIATNLDIETELIGQGYSLVAGLDEVGRGALAGPVAAGLVAFPPGVDFGLLSDITDSKKLSSKTRESLVKIIEENSIICEVGFTTVNEIDAMGIIKATKLAMVRALDKSILSPDHLLIDALELPESGIPYRSIVRGDQISTSVAGASIIAKVARDSLMRRFSSLVPGYLLEKNKGYGTAEHIQALKDLGPTKLHRKSFAPISRMLENGQA